ncbi:MAG: endonuclease MutS2 [Desulfuromonadales bacterium]|nr:endonuclease MutS2 [Desulfuromonadales bacterium]
MEREALKHLEFDKVLARIAGFVNSDLSAEMVGEISPFKEKEEAELRFGQVDEIRKLKQLRISLPLIPFEDISHALMLARPKGAVLQPSELFRFIPVFRIGVGISKQCGYRTDIPLLKAVAGGITGFPDILESLEHSLDIDGGLLDTASKLLADIRRDKKQLIANIRKRLEEIVRERQVAIFLQDDFITQRNGRWVIPVRMDSKGMVPGVVHDVSNSGETAFMEPIEIIGLANELENLIAEEKSEEIRILREITSWIREDAAAIQNEFEIIIELDRLNAIASFADMLQCETPLLSNELTIDIKAGKHPVLLLMEKELGGKEVVPLDIKLGGGSKNRILVITGPNTGGKTIALKSIGLLIMMATSGIPVPASGGSVFPMLDNLLADIGDEQSIEESLSTFSAHVKRVSKILSLANKKTVVLLDELGTGTDPLQGAALACGILSDLYQKEAMVIATTHLTDIVAYVHRKDGMVNGSMEFDSKTLSPMYRLTIGEPGQSHALDIARRYGMPDNVLETAKSLTGRFESDFYNILNELKEKKEKLSEMLAELNTKESRLKEKEKSIAVRLASIETERQELRRKGVEGAKELLQKTKHELNRIIEEARKEKRKDAREKLMNVEHELNKLDIAFPSKTLSYEGFKVGARIHADSLGSDATILSVDERQKRCRVRAGNIEVEIPFAGISEARGKEGKPKEGRKKLFNHKLAKDDAETELNLIGQRVDDAIPALERFIDSASLNNITEIRIIHGVGTGALMQSVHKYLDASPFIASYRKGEGFEGGEGATVARLV